MRKTKGIVLSSIFVLVFTIVAVAAFTESVFALSKPITNKAVAEGIRTCLDSGAFAKVFLASKLTAKPGTSNAFLLTKGANDAVKLPYGAAGVSDNNLNCEELVFGGEGFAGIIPKNIREAAGDQNDASKTTVAKFFAGDKLDGNGGAGYTAKAQNPQSEGEVQQLKYSLPTNLTLDQVRSCGYDGELKKVSITRDDGKEVNAIIFPKVLVKADGTVSYDTTDNSYNVPAPTKYGSSYTFSTPCGDVLITNDATDNFIRYTLYVEGSPNTIQTSYDSAPNIRLGNIDLVKDVPRSQPSKDTSTFAASDYELTHKGSGLFEGLNSKNAAGYAVSNYKSYNDLALTRKETYELYTYYIKSVFNGRVTCNDSSDYEAIKAGLTTINWQAGLDCGIDLGSTSLNNDPLNVYGLKSDYHFGVLMDINGVINGLASLGDLSDITGKKDPKKDDPKDDPKKDDPTNPDNPSDPDTPKEAETSDYEKCDDMMDKGLKSGEKIGSMQWILCPSMDNSVYAADWVDRMTDDWLSMDPSTYNADSVKVAWDAIRNISNILMIVFLLVIIFSQLTGYGIDNYGIKKMLPRLIVMAIVINMSWYICVMAADLSNIFGVSLRNLFAAIGNGLPAQLGSGDPDIAGTSYAAGAAVGMFAAAGSGGSAAVGAGITAASLGASAAVAIIIAVIVLALIILVAVMILFLMLGVRLIIVIICIILSPLAFASFVLPNTQNFFKKWWDAYKAALIIYPICGMLSGISHLLRNIFSEMGDVPIAVSAIAMIMPYLGFFLIPTLLKSAIAALGKFGGALTSMGNTIRNGGRAMGHAAAGAVKNSEGYKNMQNETARRRQQQSAERTIKKLEERKKGGALNDAQTRRLARAHETIRKLGNEDQAARTILADKEYAGLALTSNDPNQRTLMGDWKEAWKKGDTAKMNALTDVIIARHGPGGANEIAGALAGEEIFDDSGNFVSKEAEESFNAIRINMQQNSAFAGAMQGKASDAYQMISGGGYYTDGNGTTKRGNLAAHSQYNSIATQAKDWATQSGATLKRAAAAGAFTQRQALELLNSTDPAVQSGIQTDASKRQVLEAVANGGNVDWNDKSSIQAASISYQHGQALVENAEYDRKMAERQQQAVNTPIPAPINRPAPTGNHMNNSSPRNSVEMNIDHHGDGADEIPE